MLEVLRADIRHGEAKIDTSAAYRGSFCYIKGFDNDGYTLLDLPTTSVAARRSVYPVNKYYFAEDYNDTSDAVDKLTKGSTVVYYDGGEFITDLFMASSFGIGSGYWSAVDAAVSSSFGYRMYKPGGSTAQGNMESHYAWWGFVSTVQAGANGKFALVGTSDPKLTRQAPASSRNTWVAQVMGFYYSDSANAKIRVRVPQGGARWNY